MKAKELGELIRVSVIPNSPSQLGNRIFSTGGLSGAHAENIHWMQPYASLHCEALIENIRMDTCDILSPEDADIVLFMELPRSPDIVSAMKYKSPALKTMLMPLETPLGREYIFNDKNHTIFDAVLTYNNSLVDNKQYFHFHLPIPDTTHMRPGREFLQRKTACMISTNSRLRGRTGLNVLRSGWRFSFHNWVDYAFFLNHTAGRKRSLAREFERNKFASFDIYGDGWTEYSCGVVDKILRKNTFSNARGRLNHSKLSTIGEYRFNICYENCINDCGYISEKLFDALYGDAVPVYFGNRSIEKHVPSSCFIDIRNFATERSLVSFLTNCPEDVWDAYRTAGQKFLRSQAAKKFMPSAFADAVLKPIRVLSGRGQPII
jgi:hypothetical protein